MFTVLWDEKGVILVSFVCRVPTAISDCYTDTPNRTNVCLHQVHPRRTMSEVSFLRDNAWLCTSVHTTQTITNFEWTELPHLPYSPDISPSDYHLSGTLKQACKDTIMPKTRAAEMRQKAAEEGDQLIAGWNRLSCSKADKDCQQGWGLR